MHVSDALIWRCCCVGFMYPKYAANNQDAGMADAHFFLCCYPLDVSSVCARDEDDPWCHLCGLGRGLVMLGSRRCSFCVYHASSNYLLRTWKAPGTMYLHELHYCRTSSTVWAIEHADQEGSKAQLVYYEVSMPRSEGPLGKGDTGSTYSPRARAAGHVAGVRRGHVPLGCSAATMRVSEGCNRVVTSCSGGLIDVWTAQPGSFAPVRLTRISLSTVLGVSTAETWFSHVALVGSLLVVGLATDVWVVAIEPFEVAIEDRRLPPATPERSCPVAIQARIGMVGEVEDQSDLLDCTLPRHHSCVKAQDASGDVGKGRGVLLTHLSYRSRSAVSNITVFEARGETAQLLVVAGKAAYFYSLVLPSQDRWYHAATAKYSSRVSHDPVRKSVVLLSEVGFSTRVLQTTIGDSEEHPWFFVLTLSGLEVWSLPLAINDQSVSPCRLVVQRLEQKRRLARLPPSCMAVSENVLVLLTRSETSSGNLLSDLLFHAVPRPPADKIPELRPSAHYNLEPDNHGERQDAEVPVLILAPVTAVYRQLKREVLREVMPERAVDATGVDATGIVQPLATRFVAKEFLDSSVIGVPESVVRQSAIDLLISVHGLLCRAAAAMAVSHRGRHAQLLVSHDRGKASVSVGELLHGLRAADAGDLCDSLAQDCAACLGDMYILPSAPQVEKACEWYAKSDAPVEEVLHKLLAIWERGTIPGIQDLVLSFLQGKSLPEGKACAQRGGSPRAKTRAHTQQAREQEVLWGRVIRLSHEEGGQDALCSLVLNSAVVPWAEVPRVRDATERLLTAGEGPRVRAALAALAAFGLAAAMEQQVTVQLDESGNATMGSSERVELGARRLMELAECLDDEALTSVCCRVSIVVIKQLVMQGVPLVIKGPLFADLEAQHPTVLCRVLAQLASEVDGPGFDSTQVLRLLGPYGVAVSTEMVTWVRMAAGHVPLPPSASLLPLLEGRRQGQATEESRLLVHDFLRHMLAPPAPSAQPRIRLDPSQQLRHLMRAELLGLDLDRSALLSRQQQNGQHAGEDGGEGGYGPPGEQDWLGRLARCLGCCRLASYTRLRDMLAAGDVDWNVTIRWLSARLSVSQSPRDGGAWGGAQQWSIRHLIRIVCLAETEDRLALEAFDLLLRLLTHALTSWAAAASSQVQDVEAILLGFGMRYLDLSGAAWAGALQRLRCAVNQDDGGEIQVSWQAVHDNILTSLSRHLPPREFLEAVPDTLDVSASMAAFESLLYSHAAAFDRHLALDHSSEVTVS